MPRRAPFKLDEWEIGTHPVLVGEYLDLLAGSKGDMTALARMIAYRFRRRLRDVRNLTPDEFAQVVTKFNRGAQALMDYLKIKSRSGGSKRRFQRILSARCAECSNAAQGDATRAQPGGVPVGWEAGIRTPTTWFRVF